MNDFLLLEANISGPNAEAVEALLREFLSEQFGGEAQRAVRQPPEAATRGPEWMEWVTLALSVPGGVLAALDLAERLKLKQRAQRLIERLRSAERQGDGGVVLRIGEQPPIDLTNASAAEVVEAVEKALARQQDG